VIEPDTAFADAPDYAEALEAWRVWRVVATRDGLRLGSVVKPTLWPAGEPLVAECLRTSSLWSCLHRKRAKTHIVPDERCECGIYAGSLGVIRQYLSDPPAFVAVARIVGRVSLWGTVVECERGLRASHAYPARIYVPADASTRQRLSWDELVSELHDVYEVPVVALPVRCSEAVDLLKQEQLASLQPND
jgi:hypothetical protein